MSLILEKNQVDAFAVSSNTGLLMPGSSFALPPVGGIYGPIGLAVDPRRKFLFAPNAGTNVLTIDSTSGNLTVVSGSPFQDSADGIFMTVDPSGKYLFGVDILDNAVTADSVDSNTGIPTPVPGSPFHLTNPGQNCQINLCYPISLVEDSTGSFVFVVAYAGVGYYKTVWSLAIDAASGALTVGPSPSFQFGDNNNNSDNTGYAIATSGSFVYVSDFHGVHALRFAPGTGVLTEIRGSPFPPGTDHGGLTVTADGKFLYEALPSSNSIGVFAIDPTTGALSPIGSPIPAGTGPLILTLYKP